MDLTDSKSKAPALSFKRELTALAVGLCGFFIGRAVVFTFINPLCAAFLAVFMGMGHVFYLAALFTALGLFTKLSDIFMARYIATLGLMCVWHFILYRLPNERLRRLRVKLPAQAAAAAACTLAAGVGSAAFYGSSAYLLLIAVLEAVAAGSLTLVIKRAFIILTARRRRSNLLSGEDIAALSIVLAGIIAGASDIYVGDMGLRFFMCLYILFITAYKGGAAFGAAAGMLLGFFLCLAGYWDVAMAAALGLAGIMGGFFKRFGRLALIGGAAAAGALVLFVTYKSALEFALLYALIAAGLAFMLTPANFYFNVASVVMPAVDAADDFMEKIREETARRLNAFASAFDRLGAAFGGLSEPKTALNKNDAAQLIDDLNERACASCNQRARCWEDEFFLTYQYVFAMLGACGRKGVAGSEDMDAVFKDNCQHPDNLLRELNSVFALYKTNLRWHNRIAESRELVSQQLRGVSGIIRQLSDEIDMSLKFHEGLEEEMIAALLRNKIEVNSVIVLENKSGKYQVTVSHKPCYNKQVCVNEILPVINSVLKRRMRAETQPGCDIKKGVCAARFTEDPRLRVTSGVAHKAKYRRGGSGDSYSFMELKNGQCLLVLSDGMGAGERARRESTAAVELLEDFIESGFDKELAVRMINSALVLKSGEDSFSTLDICSVDLYTGDAEFIKIGAASTFLLRNGRVSVIRSSSLPMGMLNDVDLEVSSRKLAHNDIVLMLTDGVTEQVSSGKDSSADPEGWLTETLRSCKYHNPQDVADYVLEEAERASGELPRDDMTVLAARVWERM